MGNNKSNSVEPNDNVFVVGKNEYGELGTGDKQKIQSSTSFNKNIQLKILILVSGIPSSPPKIINI